MVLCQRKTTLRGERKKGRKEEGEKRTFEVQLDADRVVGLRLEELHDSVSHFLMIVIEAKRFQETVLLCGTVGSATTRFFFFLSTRWVSEMKMKPQTKKKVEEETGGEEREGGCGWNVQR